MTLRARIAKAIVKSMKMKEMFELPADELVAKAKEMNAKRGLASLKLDERCSDQMIMDSHCIRIMPKKGQAKGAVLFIFGGGNITDCDNGDVDIAKKMADTDQVEVWFPCYPLLTECGIMDTVEMIYATYQKMLETYKGNQISILGFSSGGALSIVLPEYINEKGNEVEMPRQVIAVSPGSVTHDGDTAKRAAELSEKDVMVPACFMELVESLMTRNGKDQVPEYIMSPEKGNMKDMPEIHFYYGSDETLYAAAPEYEKACKEQGVKYTMNVADGMFHCYPMFQFYPEGKAAFNEILDYLA